MLPILQMGVGIVGVLFGLFVSLVPVLVLALVVYKLSQIAEYNRQMVQALGRIDARLEDIESRGDERSESPDARASAERHASRDE